MILLRALKTYELHHVQIIPFHLKMTWVDESDRNMYISLIILHWQSVILCKNTLLGLIVKRTVLLPILRSRSNCIAAKCELVPWHWCWAASEEVVPPLTQRCFWGLLVSEPYVHAKDVTPVTCTTIRATNLLLDGHTAITNVSKSCSTGNDFSSKSVGENTEDFFVYYCWCFCKPNIMFLWMQKKSKHCNLSTNCFSVLALDLSVCSWSH